MIIGKVCGQIYSTINHPFYDGKKLLIVDRVDPRGKPTGKWYFWKRNGELDYVKQFGLQVP